MKKLITLQLLCAIIFAPNALGMFSKTTMSALKTLGKNNLINKSSSKLIPASRFEMQQRAFASDLKNKDKKNEDEVAQRIVKIMLAINKITAAQNKDAIKLDEQKTKEFETLIAQMIKESKNKSTNKQDKTIKEEVKELGIGVAGGAATLFAMPFVFVGGCLCVIGGITGVEIVHDFVFELIYGHRPGSPGCGC